MIRLAINIKQKLLRCPLRVDISQQRHLFIGLHEVKVKHFCYIYQGAAYRVCVVDENRFDMLIQFLLFVWIQRQQPKCKAQGMGSGLYEK
jgi:hypothetical protein